MAEGAFRKLNVDQYDEDRVLEHELYDPDPRGPEMVLSVAKQKQSEVRSLLQRGDIQGSLELVLAEPPYGLDVEEAKLITLTLVLSVLNSTKSTDILAIVEALSPVNQVTLMKYLYKAMESLEETSGNVVLGWHEKLTEVAGTGCIVRVLTDRRRV